MIIRTVLLAALFTPLAAAQAQPATPPAADYSVSDLEAALDKPVAAPSDAAPPARAPRTSSTRAFSLAKPGGPAPAARAGTASPGRASAAVAAAAPVSKDLLITFPNASADLTEKARANIAVVAQAMTSGRLATARFAIDGHTNAVGNKDYNRELSQSRARAVADRLVELGVDRTRLEVNGFGFDRPTNRRSPTAPENRRVEARRLG